MSAVVDDLVRLQGAKEAAAAAKRTPEEIARERIAEARKKLAPSMPERAAPPYPTHALGPLAAACEAIAKEGQVEQAMVGQSLLGAASLLTQGLYNAQTLTGPVPLSLYLVTLGDSGDGKTTAEGTALRRINAWQREQGKRHAEDIKDFERAKAARKKGDDPPEEPRSPYRLCRDATVEGLRREFSTGPMSQGLFSSEAAAVLSGYGMSAEHRAKTAGVFNALWDDGNLSVSRATGGRVELPGRRLAMHLMIQPTVASEVLSDPALAAIGLWPRFLIAWPTPSAPRKAKPYRPEELPAVAAYWQRCGELLDMPLAEDGFACSTLDLSGPAMEKMKGAFESFERAGKRGDLRMVKPFALRATEQACRIAGVLAAFGGKNVITEDDARHGIELVTYSLRTWLAVIDEGAADPTVANALRLYEWLAKQRGACVKLSDVNRKGPACTRSSSARDAAVEVLTREGLALVLRSHKEAAASGWLDLSETDFPALVAL